MNKYNEAVYNAFKTECDLIGEVEGVDIGVSADMFVANVERGAEYRYVNIEEAQAKLAEIKANLEKENINE